MARHPDTTRAAALLMHWKLHQLEPTVRDFAAAFARALILGAFQQPIEIAHCDEALGLVVVRIAVDADDLASAIERAQHHLFGLIDIAGLPQPGRAELFEGLHSLSTTTDDGRPRGRGGR